MLQDDYIRCKQTTELVNAKKEAGNWAKAAALRDDALKALSKKGKGKLQERAAPPESAAAMVDLTGPSDPLASGCSHRDPDDDEIEFDAFSFPGEAEQGKPTLKA